MTLTLSGRVSGGSWLFLARVIGVLTPGKHYRRWGCTQGRGPLQWHLENVEATITGWSRRHLQF